MCHVLLHEDAHPPARHLSDHDGCARDIQVGPAVMSEKVQCRDAATAWAMRA